jgi:hypothetical protein
LSIVFEHGKRKENQKTLLTGIYRKDRIKNLKEKQGFF